MFRTHRRKIFRDISSRKARTLLGYAPTHTVGEGLTQALGWYVAQQDVRPG